MDSQQLRVLAAFTDVWNLDPKTHAGQLTTDWTPAPEDLGSSSGLLQHLHSICTYPHTDTQTHTYPISIHF